MREEWEQQEGWKIDRSCSGSGGQCSVEPTSGVLDIINNMLEIAWSSYKITLYGETGRWRELRGHIMMNVAEQSLGRKLIMMDGCLSGF